MKLGLDPGRLSGEAPPTTFYLVRHAHAEWSPEENRSLSFRGQQTAQQVAKLLMSFPIEAIYASSYRRAIQTVQPLASRLGLDIQIEPGFRERDLGEWSAPGFAEAVRRTWSNPEFAFPGGETNLQAQRRGVAGLQELVQAQPGRQIVIGTHGNLLALILNHYDPGVGYNFWSRLTLPDVYRLQVEASGNAHWARIWE